MKSDKSKNSVVSAQHM